MPDQPKDGASGDATAGAPADAPVGEPLRFGSAMPLPMTGRRRVDHPAPDGLPPPEVKVVTAWRVACDGGEGALGHPRVYYTIPREQGYVDCGYCDARFMHADAAAVTPTPGSTGLQDHSQPADRNPVMGKQPVEGTGDGDVAGTDGASERRS